MASKTTIGFDFWLCFSHTGAVPKCTKNVPSLAPDERAMHCHVDLPLSLFARPQLQVRIQVDDHLPAKPLNFDVQAAETALREVLGAEVRFEVIPPTPAQENNDGA